MERGGTETVHPTLNFRHSTTRASRLNCYCEAGPENKGSAGRNPSLDPGLSGTVRIPVSKRFPKRVRYAFPILAAIGLRRAFADGAVDRMPDCALDAASNCRGRSVQRAS